MPNNSGLALYDCLAAMPLCRFHFVQILDSQLTC